ncbi:hypothetical protein F5Y10DRAFT_262148 [Nemania abortiva]|nr:hypothetical protein F5Y10DRAFT_262148 [Nemania abortiva]
MSTAATNAEQNVTAKDAQQSTSTSEATSANDASRTGNENSTDSGPAQEQLQQTGPGPKQLRSHFRGMPKQWEKNRQPKKDDE